MGASSNQHATSWTQTVAKFRVGGALPMSFAVVDDCITMQMTVPDTQSGEPIIISVVRQLPPLCEPAAQHLWLREQVHWMYRHEADEQILIDGIRTYYPEDEHG
jgi:hypothetical protein